MQAASLDEAVQVSLQRDGGAALSPSKKRIRFDLQQQQQRQMESITQQSSQRHPSGPNVATLLRPTPSDTPYTKSLKARRAELLRAKKSRKASASSSVASSILAQSSGEGMARPRTKGSSSNRASLRSSRMAEATETFDQQASSVVPAAESETPDDDDLDVPESMPEKTLAEFERIVSHALPGIKVPSSIRNLTWNKQLKTWERALADRNWSRRVDMVCMPSRACPLERNLTGVRSLA